MPNVQIGPLIDDAAVQKVQKHVDDARTHGATVRTGGKLVKIDSCADRFYAPTIRQLLANPKVRKISFTGSTPVGRQLMAMASENLTRVSLELGGHAPFIVR